MLACHEHPLEIPVHDVFPSRHVQIGCTFITLGQPDIVVEDVNFSEVLDAGFCDLLTLRLLRDVCDQRMH